MLPSASKAFASVKGWGLSYRSQYDDAVTRAQKAIGKLTARSKALPNTHALERVKRFRRA